MVSLATWLETHQEQLVASAIHHLSTHEALRKQTEGPVRWFFDSLIETIAQGKQDRLEALLRNWVTMCSIPINGETVGILPVLGVFKRAIWQEFQADPPPESALELAIQLDNTLASAVEFLSKIEAAALFDAFSHRLAAQQQTNTNLVDTTKDSFVSVAAHELKTPLTVIEGYMNMLKLELHDTASPRAALMLQGIHSGVARMRNLIEDLIDVSLIEIGLLSIDLQPVWLHRLLDIIETETREVLKQRGLTLSISRDTIPTEPTIGDPERLLKAIQKIVMNAVKYTPDGGQITITGRNLSGFVDLVIEDTGIGIPTENLERIFEKFSALGDISRHSSSQVNFKGGGPGLGLVIAKGIIEAHGGTIWAESSGFDEEKCPGSHFHLMLPMRNVGSGEGMAPLVATAAGTLVEALSRTQGTVADTVGAAREKAQDEMPGESIPALATESPSPLNEGGAKNRHKSPISAGANDTTDECNS